MTPVFDLNSKASESILDSVDTESNGDISLITARWEERKNEARKFRKLVFSDFSRNYEPISIPESFLTYERFC